MSNLHEIIRAHLLDRDLPDEQRGLTQRHLRLMEPLIRYCSGETQLATSDAVPTKSAVMAMAKLLQLDPQQDPAGFGLLDLVCVPLSRLETLPPNSEDYASLFSAMLVLEFQRAPKEITKEDWNEMLEGLFGPMAESLVGMFGDYSPQVAHFDARVQALMANNYMAALSLSVLYALNGYQDGMARLAPMLRIMPLVILVGFPVGQGMKLHALCLD
jgi:hypothetical protein